MYKLLNENLVQLFDGILLYSPFETISLPALWHLTIFNKLNYNLSLFVAILIDYLDSINVAPEKADLL